jgi:hypothetical protein
LCIEARLKEMADENTSELEKMRARRRERKAAKKLEEDTVPSAGNSSKKRSDKVVEGGGGGGYNWAAMSILAMFALPLLLTGLIYVGDLLNPDGAQTGRTREALVKCYTVADPSKLGNVEDLLEKYQGRERALFAKLRTKYEKEPACHHFFQ